MKKEIIDYLILHRRHAVSLKDIEFSTELKRASVLKILTDLSDRDMLKYQINLNNPEAKKLYGEY